MKDRFTRIGDVKSIVSSYRLNVSPTSTGCSQCAFGSDYECHKQIGFDCTQNPGAYWTLVETK